ncbi:MAG: pyridoxamine 5'-phosphate oxidase family protein [Lachnospiraceae bacterium]|nr:pyridoxamine 5'-phosphate oxidase family protein [Lachnospiraceae bacterium]
MFRDMRRRKQLVPGNECRAILRSEKRGVLSVIGDDGYPYGVPINFYYDEDENTLYFHCARQGHKIDAIQNCGKVSFTTWNHGSRKEGDWAFYVTSVIVMGKAELVDDPDVIYEKTHKLAEKYYPPDEDIEAEWEKFGKNVQIIAVHIQHMTGKLVHEK